MLSPNDRHVVRNRDGGGDVKAAHAKRFSKHTQIQAEADQHARETVRNANGGEVCIQGRDGCDRHRGTVVPRIDPTHLGKLDPDMFLAHGRTLRPDPAFVHVALDQILRSPFELRCIGD